jgi:hypothetical protein
MSLASDVQVELYRYRRYEFSRLEIANGAHDVVCIIPLKFLRRSGIPILDMAVLLSVPGMPFGYVSRTAS